MKSRVFTIKIKESILKQKRAIWLIENREKAYENKTDLVKLRKRTTHAELRGRRVSFLDKWHLLGRFMSAVEIYQRIKCLLNSNILHLLVHFGRSKTNWFSVTLSSPWWANWELRLSAAGGAENLCAVLALDWGLGVREDRADVLALAAFDIKEERIWCLNKFLKFVHVFFSDWVCVQKVHFHSD